MSAIRRLCHRFRHGSRYFSGHPTGSTTELSSKQKIRAVLSLLKSESSPERIVEICRAASLQPLSPLGRIAMSVAIAKLSDLKAFDGISSLLEELKTSRPDLRNEQFISKTIILYGQASMLDHAILTFKQMDELEICRTVDSFNALLYAFILAKKHDAVYAIFREFARRYQIRPNLDAYNAVIRALCDSGSSMSVYAVLNEMMSRGVKPNATSFGTLLAGFYREEKFAEIESVLNIMKKYDFRIGVDTFNVRIQSLCKLKRSSEAKALMGGMYSRGMNPNSQTYYHLIYGFCKEGNLAEAKRLFQEMKMKGCVPDSSCYFTLIYYLVQGGEFDAALEIYWRSVENDWVPNFTTMKALVEGLVSVSRIEDAREIVQKMKARFSSYADAWQEVENDLLQKIEKG